VLAGDQATVFTMIIDHIERLEMARYNISMESKARHLEPYFYSTYARDGVFDLPVIKRQKVDLSGLKLIRYSSTVSKETSDTDATVHFFEYDDRFNEIWRSPSSYIEKLA
jgi:hypothetical protein